jgi:hypothetical protein
MTEVKDGGAVEVELLLAKRKSLAAQITAIDLRLGKINHAVVSLSGALRRPDATEGHSKRMWRLTNERKALLAEKEEIQIELIEIRTMLADRRGLSNYARNLFAHAFVAEAEAQLGSELFWRLKDDARRRLANEGHCQLTQRRKT